MADSSESPAGDTTKAAKDWSRLRREGLAEGVQSLVTYIADNTDDPRLRNCLGFPPGYHDQIEAWLRLQAEKG